MHTCCNWEVVLLVKWKNTSVITNCCCNWQDLLIRVVELPGNLEIIWTLSRSPELYGAIRQASHPSSHRIWTLLSWPRSGSHCGWTTEGEKGDGRKYLGREYGWFNKCLCLYLFTEKLHPLNYINLQTEKQYLWICTIIIHRECNIIIYIISFVTYLSIHSHSHYYSNNILIAQQTAWMKSSCVFLLHPGVMCAVKCWSQIHTPQFMMQLDLNTESWTWSFQSPGNLLMCQKGSSSQATKTQGRKPPAAAQRKQQPATAGHTGYSSEALLTSQRNISIDPDKASPTRHQ